MPNARIQTLKQLSSRCLKMKKILKLTASTGQDMFSEEIYFTDLLIQLTNRW